MNKQPIYLVLIMKLTQTLLFVLSVFVFNTLSAQWHQTAGPVGATINCIAASGTTVFAGTENGGIFRSLDNGNTWFPKNIGMPDKRVYAIALSGTNVYAGSMSGLYKSVSNGNNWYPVNLGGAFNYISSIEVQDSNVFVGTSGGGIYRSTNYGTTFTTINTGLPTTTNGFTIYSILIKDTTVFLGTSSGVYRSTDNGNNWIDVNNAFNLSSGGGSYLVKIDSIVFASTQIHGVYYTNDDGNSWIHTSGNGLPYILNSLISMDTVIYTATNAGVYYSLDSGENWSAVNNGLSNTIVKALETNGTTLFAGTSPFHFGGMFRLAENGNYWNSINNGIVSTTIKTLGLDGSTVYVGSDVGSFATSDNGNTWDSILLDGIGAFALNGIKIFTGVGGNVLLSTNNGSSWTNVSNGLPNGMISALATNGDTIFAGHSQLGMYRSFNNGMTWLPSNNGLSLQSNLLIYSILCHNSKIYIGTSEGVFISSNNGNSWIAMNNGLPPSTYDDIYALAALDSGVFAGTIYGVYLTTNEGVTWDSVNTGIFTNFGQGHISSFATHGNTIFVAGLYGYVYYSNDYGTSWTSISAGLPDYHLGPLLISGSTLFAGINGVWIRSLSDIVDIEEVSKLGFNIEIYPNPTFNNLYIKSDEQLIEIACFNSLGQSIPVNKNTDVIDISALQSGLYYLKVVGKSGKQIVKKIIKN